MLLRQLVPRYFISIHPVGWKCSDCGQVFRIPLAIAEQPNSEPGTRVQEQFQAHSCKAVQAEMQATRGDSEADSKKTGQ